MKPRNIVTGPVRVMYSLYLGALILAIYSGINYFHPFVTGWRYPWSNAILRQVNFISVWVVLLVSIVYLYYALLGKPKDSPWSERLGLFRIALALLAIWFFMISISVYQPWKWMSWLVSLLGGPASTQNCYEMTLWLVALVNLVYLYARWAVSDRFPGLTVSKKTEQGVDK